MAIESKLRDRPPVFLNKISFLVCLLIIAAFGLYRLRFGLALGDEGHILSAPLRYSLGDRPFRDEMLNSLRWFDILLWPIMPLLPKAYTVLCLRIVALVFHLACLSAIVLAIRRIIPKSAAPLVFAAAAYSNVFSTWTPTYHTVSADLVCLCMACWINGIVSPPGRAFSALCGLAAGVCFFLAVVCEAPLVVLLAVPAVFAASILAGEGPGSRAFLCLSVSIGTAVMLALGAAAILAGSGLFLDFINALKMQLTIREYGVDAQYKTGMFYIGIDNAFYFLLFHAFFWFAAGAAFGAGCSKSPRRRVIFKAVFALLLILYATLSVKVIHGRLTTADLGIADIFEGMCLFSMLMFPIAYFACGTLRERGIATVGPLMYFFGVGWHFILAVISGSGLLVSAVITFPLLFFLLVSGMAHIFHRLFSGPAPPSASGPQKWREIPIAALCCCVCAMFVLPNLYQMPSWTWTWRLNTEFRTDKLKGIRADRRHIEDLETLLEYLRPRVRKGDYLLSFHSNPMLYFLTETRAAIPTGYLNLKWPKETRAYFVEQMVRRNRVPRYVVVTGGMPADPVGKFTRRNYVQEYSVGRYTVWRRADSAAGGPEKQ